MGWVMGDDWISLTRWFCLRLDKCTLGSTQSIAGDCLYTFCARLRLSMLFGNGWTGIGLRCLQEA